MTPPARSTRWSWSSRKAPPRAFAGSSRRSPGRACSPPSTPTAAATTSTRRRPAARWRARPLTQVGRALGELSIEHIPSYSPQGRGRMERLFGTLQKRLPPLLAAERDRHDRGGQPLPGRDLYRRAQCPLRRPGRRGRRRLRSLPRRSRRHPLRQAAARRRQRQLRALRRAASCRSPSSAIAATSSRPASPSTNIPDGALAIFHGPRRLARYTRRRRPHHTGEPNQISRLSPLGGQPVDLWTTLLLFPASSPASRSPPASSTAPAMPQLSRRGSTSAFPCTRSCTASRRISWRGRPISGDPGIAGAQEARHHSHLYSRGPQGDPRGDEPARAARAAATAVRRRASVHGAAFFGGRGYPRCPCDAFIAHHRRHVSLGELRVMSAIRACRTAALGGHVSRCDECGHTTIAYNSCRNRHCPKCQALPRAQWLDESASAELCPCPYFHVVFTLPAADRGDRAPEQGRRLRSAVRGRRRDAAHASPPIRSISAPRSASPPCCTPGARR